MSKNNPHLKNLLEGGFSSLISLFASQISLGVLSFFAVVLSTRLLGVEGYGTYGLFLSVTNLIVSFTYTWLRNGVLKFSSERYAASESMGPVIGTGLVLSGILFLLITIGLWGAYDWISGYVGIRGKYYLLFLIYIVELDWVTQINYIFRAAGQFRRFALITPLERLLYLAFLILAFFQTKGLRAETLILFLLFSNLVTITVGLIFIQRESILPLRFDQKIAKNIFHFSWPFLFTNLILYFSNWSDIYLIKYYLNTKEVGVYYLGIQFMNMASQLILIFNTMLAPAFIAVIQEKRQSMIVKFYRRFFPQIVCASTLLFLVGSGIFRLLVPLLFPAEFQNALIPILILMVSVHAWLCFMIINPYLFAAGKTLTITYLMLVSFLISLPLYFLFIPSFGLQGAAWVRVVGTLALYMMAVYFGMRDLEMKKRGLLLGAILSQGVLMIYATLTNPVYWIGYTIAVLFLSVPLLRKLGLLSSEDILVLEEMKLPANVLGVLRKISKRLYPRVA